jgi:hypothetical protein
MPYNNAGIPASNTINALLGLGGSAGQTDWGGYVNANPDALENWNAINGTSAGQQFGGDIAKFGEYHYGADGSRRDLTGVTTGGVSAADAAGQAFDTFRNSTGYQFRLGEGMNALNSQYAGAGAVKSGAAMKDAVEYGQNFGSNEFGNYLTALGNQQGVGLSAGSALAGVGQNYANSMASINDARATGIGNAALSNANNLNSMIGTLGAGILKYG